MIAVNNKPLSFEKTSNGFYKDKNAQFYTDSLASLRGGKDLNRNPVVLRLIDSLQSTAKSEFETQVVQWPEKIEICLSTTFFNRATNTEETWTYYQYSKYDKKSETSKYFPKRKAFDRGKTMVLKERDAELAFYMAYLSPNCQNSFFCTDKKRIQFEILNKSEKAKDRAENMRRNAKLQSLIYNELPEEKLRVIAKAYFVDNVDKKGFDEVRNSVWDYLHTKGKENERVTDFLEKDSSITGIIEIKAKMQEAIESKKIGIVNTVKNKKGWCFLDSNDVKKSIRGIVDVPIGREIYAKDILLSKILEDKDLLSSICDEESDKKTEIKSTVIVETGNKGEGGEGGEGDPPQTGKSNQKPK